MKANAKKRPTGGSTVVVVSSKLHARLTKAELIQFFESELSRRNDIIGSLKQQIRDQERDLLKSQALNRARFAQIEELQYRVNVSQSETAQLRLIASLDRQLETAKDEVKYYRNRLEPLRWLVLGFFNEPKTDFGRFCLSMN